MIELFPAGFEERDLGEAVELAAYTDAEGEASMRIAFGPVRAEPVEPGWEERWREFHRATQVGPFWVGPPWERPPAGLAAVVIDPGRAFGTGSHPTTRLCLELLAELVPTSLLDAGCGSGVLAVGAARLGFTPVWAVDVDPQAVEAAGRNAEANGVTLHLAVADVRTDPLPVAATVVANVTLPIAAEVAGRVSQATLVTSGYLASDGPVPAGRRRLARRELAGWAADVWAPVSQ